MGKNDYQKGMKDASKIYESKFEEIIKENNSAVDGIQKDIGSILDTQDDIMDAVEEHDEKIDMLTNFYNSIAEDKENLLKMGTDNHKSLLGLMKKLSNDIGFNQDQTKFYNVIQNYLEIEEVEEVSFEILEQVEELKVQRSMFRIICEVMFLGEENNTFVNDEKCAEYLSYFYINNKNKQVVFNETEQLYTVLGKEALINKYSISSGGRYEKKQKVYPKLEIDTAFRVAIDYPYIEMEDSDTFLFDDDYVCRSESKCQSRVNQIVKKYYNRANGYLDCNSDNFIGNRIAKGYAKQIREIVTQINNYISVNKIRIQIEELQRINSNCERDIFKICCDEMNNNSWAYKLLDVSNYIDMVEIEEDEDFVETLFGGFKEVRSYDADCGDAVGKIDEDLNELLERFEDAIESTVKIEYLRRIDNVCKEIRKTVPMEDD